MLVDCMLVNYSTYANYTIFVNYAHFIMCASVLHEMYNFVPRTNRWT